MAAEDHPPRAAITPPALDRADQRLKNSIVDKQPN